MSEFLHHVVVSVDCFLFVLWGFLFGFFLFCFFGGGGCVFLFFLRKEVERKGLQQDVERS